jgi:hypothetical protein
MYNVMRVVEQCFANMQDNYLYLSPPATHMHTHLLLSSSSDFSLFSTLYQQRSLPQRLPEGQGAQSCSPKWQPPGRVLGRNKGRLLRERGGHCLCVGIRGEGGWGLEINLGLFGATARLQGNPEQLQTCRVCDPFSLVLLQKEDSPHWHVASQLSVCMTKWDVPFSWRLYWTRRKMYTVRLM